ILLCPSPISTLFPYTTLFRSPKRQVGIHTPAVMDALLMYAQAASEDTTKKIIETLKERKLEYNKHTQYGYVQTIYLLQAHLSARSEEHTSELQSRENLVCRLL